jgi:hypothetical protein
MPPAKRAHRRVRPGRRRARKLPDSAAAPCPDDSTLKPSGVKVGEGPGNLQDRAEWFKKRSGLD